MIVVYFFSMEGTKNGFPSFLRNATETFGYASLSQQQLKFGRNITTLAKKIFSPKVWLSFSVFLHFSKSILTRDWKQITRNRLLLTSFLSLFGNFFCILFCLFQCFSFFFFLFVPLYCCFIYNLLFRYLCFVTLLSIYSLYVFLS